jgi:hypothetical protein
LRQGKTLGGGQSDAHAGERPGAKRDGDRVKVGRYDARPGQQTGDFRHKLDGVLLAGMPVMFRHDAAFGIVQGNAGQARGRIKR